MTKVDATVAGDESGKPSPPIGAGTLFDRLRRRICGLELDLSPGHVSAHARESDPSGIVSDVHDGEVAFAFRMLRSGWYRIVAELEPDVPACPRIYVAQAGAFSRYQSAALSRVGRSNRYEGRFLARLPFDSLRFDPASGIAEPRCTSIRVCRLRLHRRFFGLVLSALRHAHWRAAPFLALWTDYARLKRSKDFIDLGRFWPQPGAIGDYDAWIGQFDYVDEQDRSRLARRLAALPSRPLISIVMPVCDTPPKLLDEAIRSVLDQVNPDWELCIANDGSRSPHVRPQLDRWAARDRRIKVVHRSVNGHICHATNSAFALATGEWVAMLDHDDVLAPNALAEVALALAAHPDAALVYSDEDKIDDAGRRFDPHFKPDHSPELLRSMNYFNHLTVCRADLVRAVGGWRPGFEGSQDYDLVLRIVERAAPRQILHVPKVLYHWRAVSGSTALAGSEKGYAYGNGLRALEEHLARTAPDARALDIPGLPFYRVRHAIRQPEPPVSLIVPTRDRVDLLRVAVGSILERTTYRTFEIIVMDNNSQQEETFAYFEEIALHDNVRVIPHPHPFNYSAINNAAVRHARGEIIGLINNDVEVITPEWLAEMVSWAQLDRVGCVGAKLYFPDDTIQHAGVILGIGGVAGHSHKHLPRGENGYFSRARVLQNLSAVTGACLLVRRSVYDEVGGLDEVQFKVAFNDVDFCLRVGAAGYDNVWTPFAELYHHESPSRGADDTPEKKARFDGEIAAMKERWPAQLAADPYYSPNLTTHAEDFGIRK
ncbi:glycosyltransferase family 2 protein [Aquibium sp. ELW1220]|uniref:glycosyltransferase family 2 protein n=1 Tax=Aquibium sp. ELW1220 TaxID=2976766 RepID=UPI0025AFCF0E|nr:glycosyltransferase family 2 protein [Aquibium sp. ELW1220]MDN2582340.1 glycosyltransferase family 2 protein [Aquibium sp. ELW1220]